MRHLCFGAFLKILSLCSPRSTTNKFLCGTLFLSVNPQYDIRDDDGTVGHLTNCTNNLSPDVMDYIDMVDPKQVLACFENTVIPMLYPEKQKNVICALLDLLFLDDDVDDTVKVGPIKSEMKGYYRIEFEFNLAEILTDLFFFSIQSTDNKSGQGFIKQITKDYIESFEEQKNNIVLGDSSLTSALTISVRGKGFEDAFIRVSKSTLGLRNPEDFQLFRLRIEDNEFTYQGLKKYLNTNIGRYVYSRAEMERYKAADELESVGMDAAQYIRENSTGNELADMLLYAFLEEVLGAPKLMSSIELGVSNNCAGIHLHTIDGTQPIYQMVYGASKIEGDMQTAIDEAFKSVVELKEKRITGIELVNSASFGKSVDRKTALAVKNIVVPTKQNQPSPGTAFGIFLGYSLGLNPEDYSTVEFIEAAVERMETDIRENTKYIADKISTLHLGMHSFYIYVLPFNSGLADKIKIINMLIGGAL